MVRGGARSGAGRPKGSISSIKKEPTERIRVPANVAEDIKRYAELRDSSIRLYAGHVSAGDALPIDSAYENVSALLLIFEDIKNEAAFIVAGQSMEGDNIFDGDIVIYNRKLKPRSGDIVVADMEGGTTVKRLIVTKDRGAILQPATEGFAEIPINSETGVEIRGVVVRRVEQRVRSKTRAKR